eukprot:487984-Pelagomonas_calceolata.AAC.1
MADDAHICPGTLQFRVACAECQRPPREPTKREEPSFTTPYIQQTGHETRSCSTPGQSFSPAWCTRGSSKFLLVHVFRIGSWPCLRPPAHEVESN